MEFKLVELTDLLVLEYIREDFIEFKTEDKLEIVELVDEIDELLDTIPELTNEAGVLAIKLEARTVEEALFTRLEIEDTVELIGAITANELDEKFDDEVIVDEFDVDETDGNKLDKELIKLDETTGVADETEFINEPRVELNELIDELDGAEEVFVKLEVTKPEASDDKFCKLETEDIEFGLSPLDKLLDVKEVGLEILELGELN